ncbi:hypothetical protein GSI_08488 [Ganoderma sinense ZZ0214-1]|uniref:Uncharacterized protein n=1 Tax=Ganoderma sinense ZZ0214-1 TaxID=1077348 RepID=A0A2G8S3Z5_9APHY|nr:hypothetical protein GSI_08488 [Ganoderma sinense ZZ0214-1]
MVLVHRQWRWGTYSHPWAAHFTSSDTTSTFFSEHSATSASETTQTHTVSSVSTSRTATTTLVPVAAAERTTDSTTQAQTSTEAATTQTTDTTVRTTSPTLLPLSVAGETTSRSTSDRGESHSLGLSTSSFSSFTLSGGLTVSLPETGSAAQSTASGSSSTAQPVVTGSSGNSTSSDAGHGIGKGAIAAIVLGIVFALGLGALVCCCWKRRAGRRRDSTFIQYPFSSNAATGRMSQVPHVGALVPPNTPAEWDTHTADMAESPSATVTIGSPTATGASGYWGGLAMYPLDEKAPLPSPSPSPSDNNNAFEPATTTPSPNSTTAFALSFPVPRSPLSQPPVSPSRPASLSSPSSPESSSSSPIAPPPPAVHPHPRLPEGEPSALPYAWDHPPPSSEYLPPRTPDRRSTFRSSRTGPGPGPRRASAGATPKYSSGVPEVDRRPPEYSRY